MCARYNIVRGFGFACPVLSIILAKWLFCNSRFAI
nr:MAG TPA: hypothetical protein [Caudoviricetes sp.]